MLMVAVGLSPAGNRLSLPIKLLDWLWVLTSFMSDTQIAKMHTVGGELSAEQLARAGGVSTTAGWIAGGFYALLVLLAINGLVLQTHNR